MVAFAREPKDARTACVVVLLGRPNPDEIRVYRTLGAPFVFAIDEDRTEWWTQGRNGPRLLEEIQTTELKNFLISRVSDLNPENIYRLKTRGRFEHTKSLFDLDLMPLVEHEIGKSITTLVEESIGVLEKHLSPKESAPPELGQWMFKSVFCLLAGKILQDKGVLGFKTLSFDQVDDVFSRVGKHYGAHAVKFSKAQESALKTVAQNIGAFPSLSHTTIESLGEVYDSAFITKATRQHHGTHRTPSYLVDYMTWRLEEWIRDLPVEKRNVFEPACGHAGFLVAALRIIRDALPKTVSQDERKAYLRRHLHGVEIDAFAVEIARLSLTLADVPNPNGWDLQIADMFQPGVLEQYAQRSTILLANPPFESFKGSPADGSAVRKKTTELLRRTLPHLPGGAVVGVVIPQGFLSDKSAEAVRRILVEDYEIQEITLFPDKVFQFSDIESAVLLARKRVESSVRSKQLRYRIVRKRDLEMFKLSYQASFESRLPMTRFTEAPHLLRIAELGTMWDRLKGNPSIGSIASTTHGFSFKAGKRVTSPTEFPNATPCFLKIGNATIHGLPQRHFADLSPQNILAPRGGTVTGIPQVLTTHARVSRGPWRLKAFIDVKGHAITTNYNATRIRNSEIPITYLWAILISPIANGFLYTHTSRRHNLPGLIDAIPLPRLERLDIKGVARAAETFLSAASALDEILSTADVAAVRKALVALDAAVLSQYDLTRDEEMQLRRMFSGRPRHGLVFDFVYDIPKRLDEYTSLTELESRRHAAGASETWKGRPMFTAEDRARVPNPYSSELTWE